jgi:hypothetical protein
MQSQPALSTLALCRAKISAPIDAMTRFRANPRVLLVEVAIVVLICVLALVASLTEPHTPPVVTIWVPVR